MGGVWSYVRRPIRKFNVEQRAQRILSKDKPLSSPLYPKEQRELEMIRQEHPELIEEQFKKDSALDERLKQVYVESTTETNVQSPNLQASKSLPTTRTSVERPQIGYIKPAVIPPGKCTLDDVLNILLDYSANRTKENVKNIAVKYKLSEKVVENIVDYHMVFNFGISKEVEDKLKEVKQPPRIIF